VTYWSPVNFYFKTPSGGRCTKQPLTELDMSGRPRGVTEPRAPASGRATAYSQSNRERQRPVALECARTYVAAFSCDLKLYVALSYSTLRDSTAKPSWRGIRDRSARFASSSIAASLSSTDRTAWRVPHAFCRSWQLNPVLLLTDQLSARLPEGLRAANREKIIVLQLVQ
jgi:hypothetical protein